MSSQIQNRKSNIRLPDSTWVLVSFSSRASNMDNMLSSSQYPLSSRRRVLFSLVSTTCLESGFQTADYTALEVLLQLLQAFMSELSLQAKQFCEHAGRTEPLPGDIYLALVEMGFDLKGLTAYAFRPNRIIVPPPTQQAKQIIPKILQTGKKRPLHNYIPDSFPQFPDSHSYVSTPTFKQPITDYETLREKSSTHKRDVERGLTRFMARTFKSSLSFSLFPEIQSANLFPLIGIKVDPAPYLSALLPKDQIWEDEKEDDKMTKENTKTNRKSTNDERQNNDLESSIEKEVEEENAISNEAEFVDNPFLRPPKINNDSSFFF